MHTGHQCKVNELEYGDLLVEAWLVVNGETEIHRYNYATRYIHIIHTHTYVGYNCREQSMWKDVLLYWTPQKPYQYLE